MAIPDFQTYMKPYLTILKDGKERHFREMVEELAHIFNIMYSIFMFSKTDGSDCIVKLNVGLFIQDYIERPK